MALPLRYSVRNLLVRRSSAIFTALGVALTVAVFAGVLSLREGFKNAYSVSGRDDVAIFLRLGTNSEGESGMGRQTTEILIKERPEVARNAAGQPIAAAESFLAVYMETIGGGLTNVPIRGVQAASLEMHGDSLRIVEGRWMEFGSDEVVVGRPLSKRMESCKVGDSLMLNTTPFRVVGVYELPGAQGGEVWGDVERMMAALQRPIFQRVVAKVVPGTDFAALAALMEKDVRTPVKVQSEPEYLAAQTGVFGQMLGILAGILSLVMGLAAVMGSMNTMIASVAARTHEVGVLPAIRAARLKPVEAFRER
ncbi:MAG TPA: ABC transporter permease [Planctomycetota bacterium]